MSVFTSMQQQALINFLGEASSPVLNGLKVFTKDQADFWREQCATNMATVPRNHELASDFAARAAAFDEFWSLLEFAVGRESFTAEPTRVEE